jgi:hypothetical protein
LAEGDDEVPKQERDANTEFEESHYTEWGWFFVPLIVFMLIDYLYLSWR